MTEEKILSPDPLNVVDIHEVRNGDPNMHYRWVTPGKAEMRRLQGYTAVSKDDLVVAGTHLGVEGYRMVGTKVLMECPRSIREARERTALRLDKSRREDVKQSFHAQGEKLGVPTFEFDRVAQRGGGHTDVEIKGAPGRRPTYAMGAGIDPGTGDVERQEAILPDTGRRTMRAELSEDDEGVTPDML